MKKIMFNDKYGLTQAVLEGRKTQTRRMLNPTMFFQRLETYEGWSNGTLVLGKGHVIDDSMKPKEICFSRCLITHCRLHVTKSARW